MNIFKNKKAIGLPMVLGIIVFVIGISTALMSFIMFQSSLVEIDIAQTEEYQNAVTNVNAAVQIIAREQNLEDVAFRSNLETYFDVEIELLAGGVYSITSMVNTSNQVISYMTNSAGDFNIYENLLSNTGGPDFELPLLLTPTTMLTTFFPVYMAESFPWVTSNTEYESFQEIMDYIDNLSVAISTVDASLLENAYNPTAGNWYVDDDVKIKNKKGKGRRGDTIRNLTVLEGRILFINGDLEIDEGSKISGNVVINGDLKIKGSGNSIQTIEGTLYVNGDVEIEKNLQLGTIERPTFIFAEGDIKIDKANGVGYFLSNNFDVKNNSNITGGVYATDEIDWPNGGITANTAFDDDESKLFDFAIPLKIETETPDQGTGTTFVYTFPKLA